MTITRKYNFQPGQTIQSSQVNEELNQLVDAANGTYTKQEQDEQFQKKTGVISNQPVLYNSWVQRGESPVKFYKTEDGMVHLTGSCINGTKTSGTLICYIPTEYIPSRVEYQTVGASGLVQLQGNRLEIERGLTDAEIFFNLTYKK